MIIAAGTDQSYIHIILLQVNKFLPSSSSPFQPLLFSS